MLSRVQLLVTPWTVTLQAPLSMEFSRQQYWSELPFPTPGDLLNPGIELGSPELQADSLPSELLGKPILILGYWILKGGKKKSLIDWMTDVSSHNILALLPLINSFIKFKIMVYILKILIHNFCSVFNPTNPSDFSTLQKIVNIALWRILSQVLRFFQTILLVPY